MKKLLLGLLATLLISPAFAERLMIDVDGKLNDQQRAELQLQAAKAVQQQSNPATTVSVVKQWADIGTAIGSGLASSAKELGIAANEFANTPVGKFTVFLIAWHFIGQKLITIIFGFLWLLTTIPAWIWMYRRTFFERTVSYFDKGTGPQGAKKVIHTESNMNNCDALLFVYWITLLGIVLIGFLSIIL